MLIFNVVIVFGEMFLLFILFMSVVRLLVRLKSDVCGVRLGCWFKSCVMIWVSLNCWCRGLIVGGKGVLSDCLRFVSSFICGKSMGGFWLNNCCICCVICWVFMMILICVIVLGGWNCICVLRFVIRVCGKLMLGVMLKMFGLLVILNILFF